MRAVVWCLLLLVFSTRIYSQTVTVSKKKGRAVGAYFTVADDGSNFQLFFEKGGGSPHIDVNRSFVAGVEHSWQLDGWSYLNIAIEYSHRSLGITNYRIPPMPDFKTTGTLEMVSVPVYFRLHFGKYIFFTTGATVDFEVKNNVISNQSGIGATGGFGITYPFKNKPITIIVHPYYQLHNVLPLFHDFGGDHLVNGGVRFGVIYKFR